MATDTTIQTMLASHPDVAAGLETVHDAAWDVADARRLTLCERRIAELLGGSVEPDHLEPSRPLDDTDRACLAFTDQYIVDVAGMDDAVAAAVVEALGEQGAVDFVNGLLVVEQRQRLRLIWERVL